MRKRISVGLAALAVGVTSLGGCAGRVVRTTSPKDIVAASPTSTPVPFVQAGTRFTVRLHEALSTRTAIPGERFTAEVVQPLVGDDGRVLVPAGALLVGRVAEVQTGPPRLTLALEEIQTAYGPAQIEASVTKADARVYLAGRPSPVTAYPPAPTQQYAFPDYGSPVGRAYPGILVGQADLAPGSPLELVLTRPLAAPSR